MTCQHCKQPIRINTNSHWVHRRTGHTSCVDVVGNRSLGTVATPESQTGDPEFDGIPSENERAEAERVRRKRSKEIQATVDSIINECCGQMMDIEDYKLLEQRIIAAIEHFSSVK